MAGFDTILPDLLTLEIPTFLVAGNETTATATTWCLHALSHDLIVQSKLRDELLSLGTDSPTMDELNALPYLDGVIRETLRLHSPVSNTIRVATKDDVVPLGTPITDKKGRVLHEIRSVWMRVRDIVSIV
jgi:cytochrome P450